MRVFFIYSRRPYARSLGVLSFAARHNDGHRVNVASFWKKRKHRIPSSADQNSKCVLENHWLGIQERRMSMRDLYSPEPLASICLWGATEHRT